MMIGWEGVEEKSGGDEGEGCGELESEGSGESKSGGGDEGEE